MRSPEPSWQAGKNAPLDTEQRTVLLERAWALRSKGDYPELSRLLAEVANEDLLKDPELGYLRAEALFHTGRWEQALVLTKQLKNPCATRGNNKLFRRRLNLEAMILVGIGELDVARDLFEQVFESAVAHGDEGYIADASQNLGVVADIRCRWEDAIINYRFAITIYQRLASTPYLGATYHNLAMTYRQLGRLHEADTYFERAIHCLKLTGRRHIAATAEAERGLLRNMMGDRPLAQVLAMRARDWFASVGHVGGEGNALRILGIISMTAGRTSEAKERLEEGLKKSTQVGDRLTEAETWEELAVADAIEGYFDEAIRKGRRAAQVYRELGASLRAERCRERLEKLGPLPDAW